MKLLYITNGINGTGGLERVLSVKASYLAEHYNYDVIILSLNNSNKNPFYHFSDKIKMISISVSGNPLKYILSYKKGIKEAVRKINPDVISVCDDGLKAFLMPKFLNSKIPVVYERHVSKEIEIESGFSAFKKLTVKTKWSAMDVLASSFSKFVVLTNGNKNEWKSLNNLEVIPNPLSFYPSESSTLQNKRVIAVGKQGYQKGYDLLLQSWEIVNKKFPEWKLEIYGNIAPEFKLTEISKELKIQKSVSFYPPEKDIKSKYLEASIYVMSSRFEGFGMVLTEAMACGVPCVSFNCNYGPSDIIIDKIDGLVVSNGDYKALANALEKLISDKNMRMTMGINAKNNVKRYLPEIIVEQWDQLFKTLVNENNF